MVLVDMQYVACDEATIGRSVLLLLYSVTLFSVASLSADLGLVRLNVSSEKIYLVRFLR